MFGVNKYILIVLIVLVILCIGGTKYALKMKERAFKWENNYYAVSDSIKVLVDDNNIKTYTVQNQVLTIEELIQSKNDLNIKLKNEIEISNLKNRKIERLENLILNTRIDTIGKLRDTIIKVDSLFIPIKIDRINNKWYDLYIALMDSSKYTVSLTTRHDIVIIQHWYRNGFWLWRWLNKKHYETTFKDLNPYSSIENIRVIEVKK